MVTFKHLSKIYDLEFSEYLVLKQAKQSVDPFVYGNSIDIQVVAKLEVSSSNEEEDQTDETEREMAAIMNMSCFNNKLNPTATYMVELTPIQPNDSEVSPLNRNTEHQAKNVQLIISSPINFPSIPDSLLQAFKQIVYEHLKQHAKVYGLL